MREKGWASMAAAYGGRAEREDQVKATKTQAQEEVAPALKGHC